MLEIINMLFVENKAIAINTEAAGSVSVIREILLHSRIAFNLAVFGVDQNDGNVQNPQQCHWGVVDIGLLRTVLRKLQVLWELFGPSDQEQPDSLLHHTILSKCVEIKSEEEENLSQDEHEASEQDSDGEKERDPSLRRKSASKRKFIATERENEFEGDNVESSKGKATRLSSGIVRKRVEDENAWKMNSRTAVD